MTLPINATGIAEKNKAESQPIYLYTIHLYDGSQDLRLAEYSADVTFDGLVYQRFPISHDQITENSSGEIDAVRVRVSNISRLIQEYLELYDWRKKKVTVKLVFANQLADADAFIDFVYYIDSWTADQDNVEFVLTSKLNVLSARLPAGMVWRSMCGWEFKSTECGYAGEETVCNRTKARCKELANYSRYGAFPSISTRRMYI